MKKWLASLVNMVLFVGCTPDRNAKVPKLPYDQTRFLIITADDFGASKNINEGIKLAADKETITTISALTNFSESLPELKEISEAHPDIGIGIHLNITTGKPVLAAAEIPSLVNAAGNFYTIDELLPVIKSISLSELRNELSAQILALKNMNIKIDHLSDHNGILSFYTPFFEVVTDLALDFSTPVRTPAIAGIIYPNLFPKSMMSAYGRQKATKLAFHEPLKVASLLKYTRLQEIEKKLQKLDNLGVTHPDLMIEYFWGNPTISNYKYILEHLPEGCSELILHLGTDTRQANYPSGLDLEYFANREQELKTVTGDHLQEYFNHLNIKTIGYSDVRILSLSQKSGTKNIGVQSNYVRQ
jgi:predicted glycoside hydrolase/deacetylase ChbG (UPF0249 family)